MNPVPPPLDSDEAAQRLRSANRKRRKASVLKHLVAQGELDPAELLRDPPEALIGHNLKSFLLRVPRLGEHSIDLLLARKRNARINGSNKKFQQAIADLLDDWRRGQVKLGTGSKNMDRKELDRLLAQYMKPKRQSRRQAPKQKQEAT